MQALHDRGLEARALPLIEITARGGTVVILTKPDPAIFDHAMVHFAEFDRARIAYVVQDEPAGLCDAIFRAVDVSDAYTASICRNLGREVRILADDMARARPAFETERAWFENFLTARASALGLPVAQIMSGPDDIIVRAKIDVIAAPSTPSPKPKMARPGNTCVQ